MIPDPHMALVWPDLNDVKEEEARLLGAKIEANGDCRSTSTVATRAKERRGRRI